MIGADRDAVICDLAETYGIFDYRALPVEMLATLVVGLRDSSRIKMHIAGSKSAQDTLLIAAAVDRLSLIVWSMSKDAQTGENRPNMLLPVLMNGKQEERNNSNTVFGSGEEFEAERERLIRGN
jgi:hypothetical protein